MMSEATTDAIFSLESEAGSSPCSSPGGKGQSGPAPVRVSRSASPARAQGKRTPDTCGPLFTASSPSADLQSCLASRLQALTDCSGSPEYALTWKDQDMPWGPPICRLRALGRRTSDNGFGGWPTPRTADGDKNVRTAAGAAKEALRKGPMNDLSTATQMAGWPTPQAEADAKQAVSRRGGSLTHALKGWATPRVTTNGGNGNLERAADGKARLEDQVHGWPTARANRFGGADSHGHQAWPSDVPTEKRGALAPAFSRWLMGFPAGWENYADSATP